MHQFIINCFFFNIAFHFNITEDLAKDQMERMYKYYQAGKFDASQYSEKLLKAFKFYLQNRQYLCLTP